VISELLVLFFGRQFDIDIMVQIGFDTLLELKFEAYGWVVSMAIRRKALRMEIWRF
jgi:hypothetical protein